MKVTRKRKTWTSLNYLRAWNLRGYPNINYAAAAIHLNAKSSGHVVFGIELILLVLHIKGFSLPSKCIGTDTCPTVAPRDDNRSAASFTVAIIFMSASGMWNPSFSSPIRRPEMLPVSCRGLKGDRELVWLTCMTVRKSKSSEKITLPKLNDKKWDFEEDELVWWKLCSLEWNVPLLFCVKQLGRWWNELAEVRFLNWFCWLAQCFI